MGCACITKIKDAKSYEVDLLKANINKKFFKETNNNSNDLTYHISTSENLPNIEKKSVCYKDVSKRNTNEIQLSGPIINLLKKKVEYYKHKKNNTNL